jgi:hypothetical protein
VVALLATSAAAISQKMLGGQSLPPAKAQEKPAPAEKPAARLKAQPDQPPPEPFSGILKAVDAQKRQLTVEQNGKDSSFTVASDAHINLDGKPGELSAIPVGASIHLRKFVDPTTTRSVLAEGRWFWGVIKSVDAAGSTLTYGDNAQEGSAGRTFRVPADLPLLIDGKPGKLANIPAGARANLQLMSDQATVRYLTVEGNQVNGIIKAVDAARRTITIDATVYPVAEDAHISIDHAPGKLDDLPPGANVSLNLQVDQKTVLRVSASGSSDFGQVKAVDVTSNTITVTGGPPNDRVYTVPVNAPIFIDGKAGKLADVPVGAGLHALNLRADQKTVLNINVVGQSYHRVEVKAIDAEKGAITISDKGPKEIAGKTLTLAPQASIELDGAVGKLADVPAGSFATFRLTVDGTAVAHLQVEGPTLGGCGGSEVSAVGAVNNTITFAAGGPAEVAGKTFRVASNVWLQADAKPCKLSDLPAGSYLNITLAVDQQTVRSIWATGPPVAGFGTVKSIDVEKRTVTVDDKTYPVASNANIVLDNRGGLAALPVGSTVSLRLCIDQKTIGTIAVQPK